MHTGIIGTQRNILQIKGLQLVFKVQTVRYRFSEWTDIVEGMDTSGWFCRRRSCLPSCNDMGPVPHSVLIRLDD